MTEKLLQFIWQFGYWNKGSLQTTDGDNLIILYPGTLNKNQGPDFLNAKISLNQVTVAGTIELHLKTSDWKKHQHEKDGNYKNVVLHVVFQHDEPVNAIPVLELSSRISGLLLETYDSLMKNVSFIACSNNINQVPALTWLAWKERLVAERLQRKAAHLLQVLEQTNHHWEETFWITLAKSFGGKINGEAFEAVARSVPVSLLAKHKLSIHQLEGLVLGQAGLLNEDFNEDYPGLLQREYNFLKTKYSLHPASIPVLFHRMRPQNFPTIRLAQLAALVHSASHLFSKVIEANRVEDIKALFTVTANDYWHYHYTFQQEAAFKRKTLGTDTIDTILINAVIPLLFAYGIYHKEERYKEKAIRWLETVAGETNAITKDFFQAGIKAASAYDSQALLELKSEYCAAKRCLDCAVGTNLLREVATVYATTG